MKVLLTLCAWCPKPHIYKTQYDPVWKPITPEILRLVSANTVALSHGICPTCLTKELQYQEAIEAMRARGGGL